MLGPIGFLPLGLLKVPLFDGGGVVPGYRTMIASHDGASRGSRDAGVRIARNAS
jgi:hypothetical protein